VRVIYPFKEDLTNSPEKWTTADEVIQYLRELAVLEVIYSDLDDDEVSKDPEGVLCTWAMCRKVIQGAPASYSNSLAAMYCPDMDTPPVERVSSWLQNFAENLCTSLSLLVMLQEIGPFLARSEEKGAPDACCVVHSGSSCVTREKI